MSAPDYLVKVPRVLPSHPQYIEASNIESELAALRSELASTQRRLAYRESEVLQLRKRHEEQCEKTDDTQRRLEQARVALREPFFYRRSEAQIDAILAPSPATPPATTPAAKSVNEADNPVCFNCGSQTAVSKTTWGDWCCVNCWMELEHGRPGPKPQQEKCPRCGGEGREGDPHDANGVGGGWCDGPCSRCGGSGLLPEANEAQQQKGKS